MCRHRRAVQNSDCLAAVQVYSTLLDGDTAVNSGCACCIVIQTCRALLSHIQAEVAHGSSTCVPLVRQSISEIYIMLIDLHEYHLRQANIAERQDTAKEDDPQLPKFVTCRCALVIVVDLHSHKPCLLAVWFQESVFRLCPSRTACPGMPYPLCSTTLRPNSTYVYYRSTIPADLVAWRAVVVYGSLYRTDIWTRIEICADLPHENTDRARSSTATY